MKKHKYVQLIEFTINNQSSFTIRQARDACKISPRQFRSIAPSIFILNQQQRDGGYLPNESEVQEWILKPESYFGYLQYVQFEHAVSSSNRAQWIAIAALVATTLALVANVLAT